MIVDPKPYEGPFVTLRTDGRLYTVTVEPPLPDALDRSRTFACKSQAWGYASDLWRSGHLPFRDFTDGNTGQQNAKSLPE